MTIRSFTKKVTEPYIDQAIARDTEVTAAIAAHVALTDPHTQYLLQSEGDGRYRLISIALVDGDIPAGIARDSEVAATYLPLAGGTLSGRVVNNGGGLNPSQSMAIGATGGLLGAFEARSQGSGGTAGAAFIALHRPGSYATYFGLDTDNQLKVGGWSAGAVAYKIWNESNHGAGSGLNADLLDGIDSTWFVFGNSAAKNFWYSNTETPNTLFTLVNNGFWDCYNANDPSKFPNTTFPHWHGINIRHANLNNSWGWQFAGTYDPNYEDWYVRKVAGGAFTTWRKLWHDGNFNPNAFLGLSGGQLTGGLKFVTYTSSTRPLAQYSTGVIIYNSTTNRLEVSNGTSWGYFTLGAA